MDTTTTVIISFTDIMTGGMPLGYWFALFIFYMIGATIYQGVKVKKGIADKAGSPNKFKLWYYLSDPRNSIDFIAATLSAYIFLRFANKLTSIEQNLEWLLLLSVILGLSWQFIADKLIDKAVTTLNKILS